MPKLSENQVISSSASPVSQVLDIRNAEKYAIQLVYTTGTGTNTAKLQASLNYNPDDESGDWTDIEGSDQTLDNAGGVHMWNVSNAIYPWVRVITAGNTASVEVQFAADWQPRRG